MTNFRSMFIESYLLLLSNLKNDYIEKAKWEWNDKHQESFEVLKQFKYYCMLNYFDPKLNTEVTCNAYPYCYSHSVLQGKK